MKLLILQGLLLTAHANDYTKHALVLPDVLSEDSTAALAGQVDADRLLRSGADGDDSNQPSSIPSASLSGQPSNIPSSESHAGFMPFF